jgi:hypothetical protein
MVRFWQISLVIGIIVLVCAMITLAAGADYLWGGGVSDNTDEENKDAGVSMMVCTPFVSIIGISFLTIGILGLVKRRKNKQYAELLKANRRMKVADFAKKIGTNEFKAEKYLLAALEDKQIEGFMDRRTGEFFTKVFLDQTPGVRYGWKCDSCGAKNDSVILPGEMGKCKFCDSPVAPLGGDKPKDVPPPAPPMITVAPPPPIHAPTPSQTFWLCPVCGAKNFTYIQPGQIGTCFNCQATMEPTRGT